MSFIEINCNKSLIYFVIYWIIEITFRVYNKLKPEFFMIFKDNVLNEYVFQINKTVGDLLAGFLVLYSHCSSKRKKVKEIEESDDKINYIYEEPQFFPLKKTVIIKIIIIISILEYLSQSPFWIAFGILGAEKDEIARTLQRDITYIVGILMRSTFSFMILKVKIFKHHKYSLVIISIGFLFLLVADIIIYTCIKEKINFLLSFLFILICLSRSFAYPYEHIIIKQILLYINQEKIQFLRGILNSIIIIIISIILYFSFRERLNLDFTEENTTIDKIKGTIIYILIHGTKEFILLKVIDKIAAHSVSFLIVAKCIGNNIYGIYKTITNIKNNGVDGFLFIILVIVGMFIIIIACLIYDEVIIINKWNLDYFTKKRIHERSEEEVDYENNDEDALFPTITQKVEIEEITNKILKN